LTTGTCRALKAIDGRTRVVTVNAEADVMFSAILTAKEGDKRPVSSMAYGDQSTFICALLQWARLPLDIIACGAIPPISIWPIAPTTSLMTRTARWGSEQEQCEIVR